MSHILEHVPTARGDPESCEVTEVNPFLGTSTENVHGVVHKRSRMAFASYGDVSDTIELRPCIGARFVRPNIIEPGDSVCATESSIIVSMVER
jgi:hypothetical protein